MSIFNRLYLIFLCLISIPPIVFGKVSFTKWNHLLPDRLILKIIIGISLNDCVSDCGKRQSCEYVAYMRYARVCQLYPSSETFSRIESRNYIVIGKEDFDISMIPSGCTCDENQVCDFGECSHTECQLLSINNGRMLGNLNDVGSQLAVYCEPGYSEASNISSVQCGPSGHWGHSLTCILTTFCRNITLSNGYLIGTGNEVGASRTIFCNIGYQAAGNLTSITCDTQGLWSHIPECTLITDCPSPNGYTSNGFSIDIVTAEVLTGGQAAARCSGAGGKLVQIDQQWKIEYINELLAACTAYSNFTDYWSNGKCIQGKYLFSDNSIMPMDKGVFWVPNRPIDYSSSDCVKLTKENSVYLFDDINCEFGYGYICEY